MIGMLVAYNNKDLLQSTSHCSIKCTYRFNWYFEGTGTAAESPFVIAFNTAGVKGRRFALSSCETSHVCEPSFPPYHQCLRFHERVFRRKQFPFLWFAYSLRSRSPWTSTKSFRILHQEWSSNYCGLGLCKCPNCNSGNVHSSLVYSPALHSWHSWAFQMAVQQLSSNYLSPNTTLESRLLNKLIAGSSALEQPVDSLDGFQSTWHTYAGVRPS